MAHHDEDLKLVERMLAGDQAAFEAFGELGFRAAYRFTLGRLGGDRQLALEIVQTALARALSRLESYRGEAALLTWLCACCQNEIRMHFRRRRTAPVEVEWNAEAEAAIESLPEPGDTDTALLAEERDRLVHLALDSIPAHYGQALEWMYLERLPVKVIAQRLGLGLKAAESLLTRARQAFRRRYTSLGGSG